MLKTVLLLNIFVETMIFLLWMHRKKNSKRTAVIIFLFFGNNVNAFIVTSAQYIDILTQTFKQLTKA